jgi:hypothetical protein
MLEDSDTVDRRGSEVQVEGLAPMVWVNGEEQGRL